MEQELLDALKTKFTGVDERILRRIAASKAKTATTGADVATITEGVTFQQVIESYGDSRATEATQTAVANYEKKHNLKDGQKPQGGGSQTEPASDQNPNAGGNDLASQITAAVSAALTPVLADVAAIKGEKVATVRKQQLSKIVEKLPEGLRKPYDRIDVQSMDDEAFAAFTQEVQTEVDGLSTELGAKGAAFTRPPGGGSGGPVGKPSDADLDAVAGVIGSR